jgi:aromatic ring-cleaving dioxygenase
MNTRKWQRKRIGELFDVQLGKMLNEKAKKELCSHILPTST